MAEQQPDQHPETPHPEASPGGAPAGADAASGGAAGGEPGGAGVAGGGPLGGGTAGGRPVGGGATGGEPGGAGVAGGGPLGSGTAGGRPVGGGATGGGPDGAGPTGGEPGDARAAGGGPDGAGTAEGGPGGAGAAGGPAGGDSPAGGDPVGGTGSAGGPLGAGAAHGAPSGSTAAGGLPQDSSTGGAVQPAPQLDPEQLRQFQQFQDFLRYSEAQRQGGGEVVPTRSAPVQSAPGYGVQVPGQGAPPMQPPYGQLQPAPPPLPAPRPQIKVPRWAKRLAGKLLSAFLFLLVLIIAGTLAYRHFFPDDDPDLPEAQMGGGGYHTNVLYQTDPYAAMRLVYKHIGQNRADRACGLFAPEVREKFANDLGYATCEQAGAEIYRQVTDRISWASSLPFGGSVEPGTTEVRIDSCSYDIRGGPALGVFLLREVELNQWLITGHEPGPKTCPVPSTPPSR